MASVEGIVGPNTVHQFKIALSYKCARSKRFTLVHIKVGPELQ